MPAGTDASLLRCAQPGGTFLACSAPLQAPSTALSVLQAAGAYVSPFGYPSSTSYATNKVSTMCGLTTLPTGSGGMPIALSMNGQVIDVVRAATARFASAAVPFVPLAHTLTPMSRFFPFSDTCAGWHRWPRHHWLRSD